ncbi:MAG: hypothetical protein EA378_07840 [Phycisphaerales bacterium]|nr:MAG: hypothetical protein EA378_07840 [Phycisphaerales bacterium]
MTEFVLAQVVVEWSGRTTVHPVGLAMLLILGAFTLVLPRRWAVLPMILLSCMVPAGQRIAVGPADFDFIRILVLFGWARLLIRGEYRGYKIIPLDIAVTLYAVVSTLFYTINYGSIESLIFKLGVSYDAIGLYFFFRCTIRTLEDATRIATSFAIVSIPTAIAFAIEKQTGNNLFSVMGGVPDRTIVRHGRLRCQGAFSSSILAGCYWASVLPLMASLWWRGGLQRVLGIIGIFCGLAVIGFCSSSTPVIATAAVVFAGAMWFLRHYLRHMLIGLAVVLFCLHFAMNNPVWHLISRVDLIAGNTGYHRYRLIDSAINNFSEWALFGTQATGHWGHQMFDITNQYILEGVRAGFISLALFVTIIVICFIELGRSVRATAWSGWRSALIWGLGATMFAHVTSFFGISYFGQIVMLWYLTLGMIGSTYLASRREASARLRSMRTATDVRARAEHRERRNGPNPSPAHPRR